MDDAVTLVKDGAERVVRDGNPMEVTRWKALGWREKPAETKSEPRPKTRRRKAKE